MPRPLLLALPLVLAAVLLLAPRLADALALRIAARLQPLAQLASTSPRLEAEPESDPQPAQVADATDAASGAGCWLLSASSILASLPCLHGEFASCYSTRHHEFLPSDAVVVQS